jgi:cell division protein FtsB
MRLMLPGGAPTRSAAHARPRRFPLASLTGLFRVPVLTPSGRRVALVVAALMLGTLCLGDRGLVKTVTLLRDRAAVRAELVRLETHRTELEAELRRYSSDSATIERVARESLDWVRRGETVYKFPAK